MHPSNTNKTLDWSGPNILMQIVQYIKDPLNNIITASQHSTTYDKQEIIFSSSRQIQDIVDEILKEVESKKINLTIHERADFFEIYESNKNVQKMCSNKISPEKVTKQDQSWLMDLEKEIYGAINQNDLSLFELSYKMAVSERQLHRKITRLVRLTPNKYIRVLRLHKAKQIIDNFIEDSISQIAYAVGYNDVHYFSKLFSNQYNVSPKELINSIQ